MTGHPHPSLGTVVIAARTAGWAVVTVALTVGLSLGTARPALADPSPVAPVTVLVPPHPGPPVCC